MTCQDVLLPGTVQFTRLEQFKFVLTVEAWSCFQLSLHVIW